MFRCRNCLAVWTTVGLTPTTQVKQVHASAQGDSMCNRSAPFATFGPMNTTALNTRRPRGINPKGDTLQQLIREHRVKLPKYLEMAEVNALIAAAPNPRARLIM